MKMPWRRRPAVPVIKTGQSAEWMEVLDCYPLIALRSDDGVEMRELREYLGDMVFLASRLLEERAAWRRLAELERQHTQLEQETVAPRRSRAWRR